MLKSSNYIDQNRFIQKKIKNLDLVIFDGYKFNYKCQKFFYDQNIKVVSIDDEAKRKFCSNLIINHAPKISSLNYPGLNTRLGLNYLMVQDYFFNNLKKHHKKQNVFICLGASNYSTKYLIRILKILAYVPEIYKIYAIAQNNHYFFKDSEIKKLKNKINIYSNVESIKVSNLLKQSTIAICSASTVSLEACASKVPVIVGFLNNNQKNIYKGILKAKIGLGIGKMKIKNLNKIKILIRNLLNNKKLRSELINNQKRSIDGKSHLRIKNTLLNL